MKTSDTVLAEFIKDFNLEVPEVGVCFNADIEFTTLSIFKKFNCEVHIITMAQKQMSVVYLLHQQLAEHGIPDVFPFDTDNFSYIKMRSLVINNYDLLRGKYSLSISPINLPVNKKLDVQPGLGTIAGK